MRTSNQHRQRELQQLLNRARKDGGNPKIGEVHDRGLCTIILLVDADHAIYVLLAKLQAELCQWYSAKQVQVIEAIKDPMVKKAVQLGGYVTFNYS